MVRFIPFAFTVDGVVTLGRIPFIKLFAGESEVDRKLVVNALGLAGISELAQHIIVMPKGR